MVLFKSDYNKDMVVLSTMLGKNIVNQSFFSVTSGGGKVFNGTRAKKVDAHTFPDEDGTIINYNEYDSGSIANYRLSVGNNVEKSTIETYDVRLEQVVLPRITIILEDKESDVEYVQLDVSSFSINATIRKRVEGTLLTRSISYQDCNYQNGYVSFEHPARLKTFCSREESKWFNRTDTRNLSIEQIYPLPIVSYTDLSHYDMPDRRVVPIELDSLDSVIKGLLSNRRSVNLFDYVFDRLETKMPGVIDYLNERLPFFTDTTDKIFAHDDVKLSSFINDAYASLVNKELDLPKEKGKQKELTN